MTTHDQTDSTAYLASLLHWRQVCKRGITTEMKTHEPSWRFIDSLLDLDAVLTDEFTRVYPTH